VPGVDETDVGRDVVVGGDEALGVDRHAVEGDALPDRVQVRAGEAPAAQAELAEQGVDHPGRGRLAIRPRDVDDRHRVLRRAEKVEQLPDPVQGGRDVVLGGAGQDVPLHHGHPPLEVTGLRHDGKVYGPGLPP